MFVYTHLINLLILITDVTLIINIHVKYGKKYSMKYGKDHIRIQLKTIGSFQWRFLNSQAIPPSEF